MQVPPQNRLIHNYKARRRAATALPTHEPAPICLGNTAALTVCIAGLLVVEDTGGAGGGGGGVDGGGGGGGGGADVVATLVVGGGAGATVAGVTTVVCTILVFPAMVVALVTVAVGVNG